MTSPSPSSSSPLREVKDASKELTLKEALKDMFLQEKLEPSSFRDSREIKEEEIINPNSNVERFRAKIKDLPKKYVKDTPTLLRFLQATDNSLVDAEHRYRQAVKWREDFKTDKIKKGDVPNEYKTGKMFMHGKDKLGRPCLVVFPIKHDPYTRNLDECVKGVVYWIEKAIKKMKGVEQFVIIYDTKQSSHQNHADWSLIKELLKIQEYYPERLGACYILRANWLVQLLFAMVAPIFDKKTLTKILILDENFRETLRKQFSDDNLLMQHGGTSSFKLNMAMKDSWDGDLNIHQELHDRVKFILEAETDIEKQKKISDQILKELDANTAISNVHKELLKDALSQLMSERVLKNEKVFSGQSSINLPARTASVLRDKADKIQLDIANLAIRKQQLEWIIREAAKAKKEIPEIEQQLAQKHKDLTETMKYMKNTEELESKLSIVDQINKRQALLDKIPKMTIKPPTDVEIISISGPEKDGQAQSFQDIISGKSVSLYPLRKDTGREGDPIADRFNVSYYENCAIFSLCDGCGWGTPSKEAAQKAGTVFVEYMKNFKSEIVNTSQAARIMLRAFSAAHASVSEGTNNEEIVAGTTTMLGGLIFELEDSKDGKWGIVLTNLGDCKAFHFSPKQNKIADVTVGNRWDINDVRDPGGRLGPYVEGGKPDLRNLDCYFTFANDDDVLILLSDGVYDNFDPAFCGKSPKDANINVESNLWENVKNDEPTSKLKSEWTNKTLSSVITASRGNMIGKVPSKVTPASLTERLIIHAVGNTKNGRSWMEANPNKKIPDDKVSYPGKMDHATCLALKILSPKK